MRGTPSPTPLLPLRPEPPACAGTEPTLLLPRGSGKTYKLRAMPRAFEEDRVGYEHTFEAPPGVRQTVVVDVHALRPTWRGQLVAGAPQLQSCADVKAIGFMLVKTGGVGDFALDVFSISCLE